MSWSTTPSPAPEIITPQAVSRLQVLDEAHAHEAAQLTRLESVAKLMDARFNLPFLPVPIGLDSIVGLIPGIGDTISLGVSFSIIAGAFKLGLPKAHLLQMGANVFLDWLIGLVPFVGDIFDIGWQANIRNVKIARGFLESRWEAERTSVLEE